MTLSKFAPLLEGHPFINKVHAVDINAGYSQLRQTGFEMEMMGYVNNQKEEDKKKKKKMKKLKKKL